MLAHLSGARNRAGSWHIVLRLPILLCSSPLSMARSEIRCMQCVLAEHLVCDTSLPYNNVCATPERRDIHGLRTNNRWLSKTTNKSYEQSASSYVWSEARKPPRNVSIVRSDPSPVLVSEKDAVTCIQVLSTKRAEKPRCGCQAVRHRTMSMELGSPFIIARLG